MAASLGLRELAEQPLVVPAAEQVIGTVAGTAFDIRARIELGGFIASESTSAAGVDALPHLIGQVENGEHRARVLSEGFSVAEEILASPAGRLSLTRASVLLAYCEQVYRGGADALAGTLGAACDAAADGYDLASGIAVEVIDDIEALLHASQNQIEAWREDIAGGARFEPNPGFSGARLLGGADGDWMIGNTLIDCKVYSELSVPKLRDLLRQLLGYVMLDLDDALGIRNVAVWLPRQQQLKTWTLEQLFGGDPETQLPKLREGFISATSRNQIAVHVPVSERRKLQLLADNRHTPHAMLMALAQGDDTDLRFRVGRNASTPESIVRTLASDRLARVREGVASNTNVPLDVLERLAEDSSVVVSRAAMLNSAWTRKSRPSSTEALPSGTTPSVSTPGELVPVDVHPSTELVAGALEISQDRSLHGTPGRVLASVLRAALEGEGGSSLDYYLPEASRMWGRTLHLPSAVSQGVPPEVLADLVGNHRPAFIRRTAAWVLPIADTAVRQMLFADADPQIRWDALERSMSEPDSKIGEVLTALAGSRKARIEFVAGGLSSHERWQTPTEYNDQVTLLLASHPATPSEALDKLVGEKSAEVLVALAAHPALSAESMDVLCEKMTSARTVASRILFAESAHRPLAALEAFAADKRDELRAAVARNPATPASLLSQLAQDTSTRVQAEVMANPSTPGDLSVALAESLLRASEDLALYDVVVKVMGASGLALPVKLVEDALDRLAKSRVRDPDLRSFVARHPLAGASTLERLARSKDADVRAKVARNSRTALSVLESLARDEDSHVRWWIARNERLSQDVLNVLLLDEDLSVRIAAYRQTEPGEGVDSGDPQSVAMEAVPRRTSPTIAELQEMAANSRAEVRLRVAYSDYATPDILAFLGGERRSKKVRQAVAAHPKTPIEVLRSLATRDDADILLSLALHPESPADLLVDLAGRSVELAVMVALNPNAPIAVVEALSEDSDLFVKYIAQVQLIDMQRELKTSEAQEVLDPMDMPHREIEE
ncbi:MAG: HEAT repeat domain-containing protein [Microbacterium sp.]|jgi:hypothetical protein|uniref:HEAT repeat domain-containing protein n=1 Tax=Microbacterium sp. TaxID=51671 RepID=UPI00282A2C29|nr:HEAT repeat domain-containing protein [Microbacterium sp.]MDR2323280.1 HEAT repeat domain-containing protein [Microbacterium sp.]